MSNGLARITVHDQAATFVSSIFVTGTEVRGSGSIKAVIC